MLQVSHHPGDLLTEEDLHEFGELPGGPPPLLLRQGIPFPVRVGFRFGVIEEIPQRFLEEQDLLAHRLGVDLHHLGMGCFCSSVLTWTGGIPNL